MSAITSMRRLSKSIFLIVAVVFIGGFLMNELWQILGKQTGKKMLDKGVVGKVGNKVIKLQEYQNAVQYFTVKYQTENKVRDISPQDQENINQQTWQYLTQEKTWSDILKKGRIKITDAEIIEIMKANPPENLRTQLELMTNGQFDPEKYQNYLFAEENRLYLTLYARDLADALPKEKFRLDVINSYRVTNGELNDAQDKENTAVKLTYLYFGPRTLKDRYTPPDAELKAYYDKHKDKYLQKTRYRASYVFFAQTITQRDSEDAQRQIEDASAMTKTDEFGTLIRDFSDSPSDSAPAWIKIKDLDSITRKTINSLKNDSVTGPFMTYTGWQIIKINQKTKDSLQIQKITKAIKLTRETESAMTDSVGNFISKAQSANFDTVAQEYGLFPREMPPMTKDRISFPALYNSNQMKDFILSAKPQKISEALKGRNGYYVFQFLGVEPQKMQPFDQAKTSIEFELRREKEKDLLKNYAETYIDRIRNHVPLESIVRIDTLIEIHTEEFASFTECRNRKGSEFAGAAYALNPGETYGVLATDMGSFVIRCDLKTQNATFNPATYQEQRKNEIGNQIFQSAVKQPEITDYRDASFF
jgi:parvulin-like peptidyl-prolyl isomerase